jgi:hypothetical protein
VTEPEHDPDHLHRRSDPDTSEAGARSISSADCHVLATWLDSEDRPRGWTRWELEHAMGWDSHRTSRRMSDVRKLHHMAVWALDPQGERHCRRGPSNRPQYAIRSVHAIARQHRMTAEQVLVMSRAWDQHKGWGS